MAEKTKVVVTDYIEENLDWEAEELAKEGICFKCYKLKFCSEDEVLEKICDADIIVTNMVRFDSSLVSRLTKCRLLIRHGIGYDNVDVDACTEKGIQFAYQPDYCTEDVAEHAVALILACARKIVWSRKTLEQASENARWDFSGPLPIYRMAGKTLGILGVGRIGSRVYRKVAGLGFRILGCDPYLSQKRKDSMENIEWVDKETIFKESDYLTVHTPLNDDTRYIVNAEMLGLMKPTACIVNTSRGGMVDTESLAAALREKKIANAAIDVYEVEPPPKDLELFELDNVILTPHIGWASEEAGLKIRENILDDIRSFAAGKDARCVVNEIRRNS